MKIDSDAIKLLAKLLQEVNLTEIEYQVDSLRIKVSRQILQTSAPVVAQTLAAHMEPEKSVLSSPELSQDALENHPGVIEAQMVGTVYLSPGPEAVPFVSLGDMVSHGQTLFIIEAMKVMNMIKAPRSGIVKHIFVKDSQPVEYGDPIIIIE
ncbi:MAG: acetyl-CoA carboxylase biotin carboxyl carrier protein [Holosporaceae bacterium]|jgi:acetyl-CoA carboxylase biotin carboxyl carrier protein|nr:acetyl-CoA carboxylase biotin carboxyl carrier protein [Holosporaceae bacterium]